MTKSIFACVYITCTGYRYRKSLLPDKGFRERERDLIFGTIIKTIKSPYLEARDTLIILPLVEQMVIFTINCKRKMITSHKVTPEALLEILHPIFSEWGGEGEENILLLG